MYFLINQRRGPNVSGIHHFSKFHTIKIGYSLTNCQHITARKTDVMNGTVQTKKATFCLMKNN